MYGIIENGVVVNVVIWNGDTSVWQPTEGMTVVAVPEGSTVKVGYTYDGSTFNAPTTDVSLSDAQTEQKAIIDAAYASAVQQDVTFKTTAGVTESFQADSDSQALVIQATQGYQIAGSTPSGFYWKAVDNALVPFVLADLQGLCTAILSQQWAAFQKRTNLKTQIDAATTVEAVQAVVWG